MQDRNFGSNQKLDKFVISHDPIVRVVAAEKGYALDILVHDIDPLVRWNVAQHGRLKDLTQLVYDKEKRVQYAVLEQGYGLDYLYKNWENVVIDYLFKNKYKDINDWIKQNPNKCALIKNKNKNNKSNKSNIKDSIKPTKSTTKSTPTKDVR